MTLAEIRTRLLALCNRTDCTPALADIFLSQGMGRIQRELRAPIMERVMVVTANADEPIEMISLPKDYMEMIEVLCDGQPLTRSGSYRALMRQNVNAAPCNYARFGNTLYLRGAAPGGSKVELLYYGSFSPLVADTDHNEATDSIPDLLVYAALTFAGDHFSHDNGAAWVARYQELLMGTQGQAIDDEFSGGPLAISPAYPRYI